MIAVVELEQPEARYVKHFDQEFFVILSLAETSSVNDRNAP